MAVSKNVVRQRFEMESAVRRHRQIAVPIAILIMLCAVGAPAAAHADVGSRDQSFSGTSSPLGTKRAESSLWFNDGSWWANMWDTSSQDFHIWRFEALTNTWLDLGVTVDTRSGTHADALWDGEKLYIASHVHAETAASGYPTYLYRFSYDAIGRTYTRDAGFPVQINNYKSKSVVIDKDSTGRVWATWIQGSRPYVNRTVGDDLHWGTPFVPAVSGTTTTSDELSSVIAFGGDKIGLMWSNQTSTARGFWFAVHQDGAADTTWDASVRARSGAESADDHINLKTDSSGRVYAAVKDSFDAASDPETELLVRDPATGAWSHHTIGTVAECPNRPIVLVDETEGVLHVLQTGPTPPSFTCTTSGGTIYEKTSPIGSISFPSGHGTAVIQDSDSVVHDVSSTKQAISGATGLAAVAVNPSTKFYWHTFTPLAPPSPPTASFTGSPTAGSAPLAVSFRDASTGGPTGWRWDFGDGEVSTAQNPQHTYTAAGTYTVTLTVTNAAGSDTQTRVDYIAVDPAPPSRTFTPVADAYVKESEPSSNFRSTSNLRVKNAAGNRQRAYLKFNVADVPAVQSAKLRLFVVEPSPDGGSLRSVDDDTWTESGLTWNSAPPFGSDTLANAGPTTTGTWVELNLTGHVTGNGTYSFALVDGSSVTAVYNSRDGAHPPELEVMTSQ
jgi:PKD repeat protein